jgi:hypothetical protein
MCNGTAMCMGAGTGTCQACGGDNQPCCANRACNNNGCCTGGGTGVCAANGTACPGVGGMCMMGRCAGCGTMGMPCCGGRIC